MQGSKRIPEMKDARRKEARGDATREGDGKDALASKRMKAGKVEKKIG